MKRGTTRRISLAVGSALAMTALVLAWGEWRGARAARGAAPPDKPRAQAAFGDVVINEVAWMGTQAGTADEWIELLNTTDEPIPLAGWHLADDDSMDITLSGLIPARGYYLLERTDDTAVADVVADWTGSFGSGGLSNDGQVLTLTNGAGAVVDTANADGGPWPAGRNDSASRRFTMERVNPYASDADDNWATNDGLTRNGLDAGDNPVNGTPKARNSRYAVPGLAVHKLGPEVLTPGFPFTNHIVLGNTGTQLATSVVVTDVLPAGLTLVAQASPFTFTQPTAETLVWQAGTLSPGTGGSIALTLQSPETLSGTVTNVVTATDATGRTEVATWSAPLVPYVRLYALHPHALYSGDEAVALINLGAFDAPLTGWGLSDGGDAPQATLPTATLPPGEILWLADDADDFFASFGFAPNFALAYTTHAVPLLSGTWPGFANAGDEALLFDSDGHVADTLVYGSGLTTTTGWGGAAVPYPRTGWGPGQILYRKLDQTAGLPVPEADTAADWAQAADDDINGKKVRFPGWDLEAFFFPAQVTQAATLTAWVAPDGLYEGIAGLLAGAQRDILIETYAFDNPQLVRVITDLLTLRPSLAVTMLLEGRQDAPVMWACGQMAEAGADIFFMHRDDDPPTKIYDRYALQHSKFLIVDDRWALIGSENLSPNGMPADPKADGTWGHRGVYLATDAPGVVARARAIFHRDLDTAHSDIVPWGSHGYTLTTVFTPTYDTNPVTYTAHFSQPLVLSGEFAFQVVQSPENSLRDRDALLGLLARAGGGDTVLAEQLYEHQFWGGGTAEDPNPRLEAHLAAARRGAAVRLLLDSRYDYGRDNQATADYVNHIAQVEGLDLEARLGNPTGEGIHNKMVLAWIGGRGFVHVGSINGSEASNKVNRELALQVRSDAAYEYLRGVFEYDWQASEQSSPHAPRAYLPLVVRGYVPPADHLVISELLYDPAGVADADGEWIEIYNPTATTVALTGHHLSDGDSYGDGTAAFPGGSLPPGGVILIAQRADAFRRAYGFPPDYELKDSDPGVPDMARVKSRIGWGNGGDEAILRGPNGVDVDVVVYGSGSHPEVTSHPGVRWGHSLERKPADRDTDDCSADFWERYTPTPGQVTLY